MRFSQYLRQLGQPIAYYPQLAKPLGGVTSAILFGQLFFWQDKTSNPLGVYKTQAELEQETGLTRREQETARKKLVELGILIETHKRLEHRIYFKLNLVKFDALMDDIREEAKPPLPNVANEHSPMAESDIREEAKPPFVNTEITTETTNNKKTSQKKSQSAVEILASFGIEGELAEDFIQHRKAKRAVITNTVMTRLKKQADLAKLPLGEVVAMMIERGWQGFQADWDWKSADSKKPKFSDDDDSWWRGKTIEIRGY
ncbi:DNA replication protein [Avibacterium sp. 21-594]|uniref:DNA replication protein n=1 Tax=Avibacterium sp. 21-594 TaxID=2911535 RepID=UPI002245969C|nr:DNA replication protein [Avibacterium sp. 21-594]MCW9716786.1 DNA replication protein [Avibacterium sp. 21-594]